LAGSLIAIRWFHPAVPPIARWSPDISGDQGTMNKKKKKRSEAEIGNNEEDKRRLE
jgi:hypothetical protein